MMYSISFVSVKLRYAADRGLAAVAGELSFPHSLFSFSWNIPFSNMSSSFDAVEFIARLGFASVHNSTARTNKVEGKKKTITNKIN